ncbi:DUF2177 family protein [Porphyrobacter sp. LM 6]|jgi:uncharacterized membrane protein|uniref:DUF2177 family protein n=1 Tax=Porphyrobacter sp. LM 6 TaxID=1896196 RepID=UPI000846D3CD|nr:DUF2177 family protein [Porphyrobacter sp. LM 6]AOL94752.1 putative membrane protein [Porphyrobacter sp. LM 6]
MLKWIIAYGAAAVAFGAMDAVWLRWASGNLYKPVIGELMAKNFNVGAAAAFYLIYIAGMTWFAIKPGIDSGTVQAAMLNGILLGGLCYATFDLTSQAVFKVWATHVSVLDILWGAFATGAASAIAAWVVLRFAPA